MSTSCPLGSTTVREGDRTIVHLIQQCVLSADSSWPPVDAYTYSPEPKSQLVEKVFSRMPMVTLTSPGKVIRNSFDIISPLVVVTAIETPPCFLSQEATKEDDKDLNLFQRHEVGENGLT